MKSLQIVTPHKKCIFNCPFCISKSHSHNNCFENTYEKDFNKWKNNLEELINNNSDLECVVITGTNEPMQSKECVKDIINIVDGKKIGNIIDARFNPINGIIEKLILSPSKSLFSLKNSTLEIGFNKIKKIGEDVILIEYLPK